MTDGYSRLIAVTDRKYFFDREDPEKAFFRQLERLFSLDLKAVVLREKDLGLEEYLRLAEKVKGIAGEGRRCRLILHQYPEAAEALGIDAVHLPLHIGPFHGGRPHRGTVRRIVSVCGKYLRDDMQAGTGGKRTCLAEGSGGIGKHPGLRDRRDHPRQNEGNPGDRSRRRLHDVRFHAAVRSAVIMQIKKGQRASEPSDLSFLLKHLPVNQGERVDQCDMVASQA